MYSLIKSKIPVADCKCDSDFIQNYWKLLKSTHKYLNTIVNKVVPVWIVLQAWKQVMKYCYLRSSCKFVNKPKK